MVEYAFSVLTNKWRIFHRQLDVTPQFCDSIVKAYCILYNFVRLNDGFQILDILYDSNFENIEATWTRGNIKGKRVGEYLAKYFTSPQGDVPWQYDKV